MSITTKNTLDVWLRYYKNSKAIVVEPTDPTYLTTGLGVPYTNMASVVGGMFGAAYPSTGYLQGGIDTPSTAWAAINLVQLYKINNDVTGLTKIRLIGDFFVAKALNIKIWNSATFKAFPNEFTYNVGTGVWQAKTTSIQTRTLLHVAWALLEIYDVTRDSKYSTLAGSLLDTVSVLQTLAKAQVDGNEIAPYFKGALYNAITSSDGINFEPSFNIFTNVVGDMAVRATNKWISLFGNTSRATFDLYAWATVNYNVKNISEHYMNHLVTMYNNYGLRRPNGHNLIYCFSHYNWTDPAHANGYMIPTPKNWDFINDVWGQDQWFTGDLVLWAILGFAEAGYTTIATSLATRFYNLKAPDDLGRLLFRDRYTSDGTSLPDDLSKSIDFTGLFLNIAYLLGMIPQATECMAALEYYQSTSSFVNVAGSYSWDATQSNSVVENKTLGEIAYAVYVAMESEQPYSHMVATLPTPPSRLSRAEVFVRDSSIFLAYLPIFREEVNRLSVYINESNPNYDDYGIIGAEPAFPAILEYLKSTPLLSNSVKDYVGDLDKFWEDLQAYSINVNAAAPYIQQLLVVKGSRPLDVNKPLVSGITTPPSRVDTQAVFNQKTEDFIQAVVDNINSIHKALWYVWVRCNYAVDYGLVSDTEIQESLDYGLVTDTIQTY